MPSRWWRASPSTTSGAGCNSKRAGTGGNGRQLVNYLAFEADANLNPQLSLVARLHHRSGIYGTLNCNKACDINGYLLGVRYRFRP